MNDGLFSWETDSLKLELVQFLLMNNREESILKYQLFVESLKVQSGIQV